MKTEVPITIAIDGPSSTGKSTLARDLARHLSYVYIDSGAMYRAVALFCLESDLTMPAVEKHPEQLDKLSIRLEAHPERPRTFLNDRDVTEQIRSMEVSNIVSEVASISAVRRKLVSLQQAMGDKGGVVMDGRDIGTVVFPDAEIKIYLICDLDSRVQRRYTELNARGYDLTEDEVKVNLLHRDHIDSTRADSPLRPAEDSIQVDNSHMTLPQTLDHCLKIIYSHYPYLSTSCPPKASSDLSSDARIS